MAEAEEQERPPAQKIYKCQKNAQGFPDRDAFRRQHLQLLSSKLIHQGIEQAKMDPRTGDRDMAKGSTCTKICKKICSRTDPFLWECKVPWIFETVKIMLEEEVAQGTVIRGDTIFRYKEKP